MTQLLAELEADLAALDALDETWTAAWVLTAVEVGEEVSCDR